MMGFPPELIRFGVGIPCAVPSGIVTRLVACTVILAPLAKSPFIGSARPEKRFCTARAMRRQSSPFPVFAVRRRTETRLPFASRESSNELSETPGVLDDETSSATAEASVPALGNTRTG